MSYLPVECSNSLQKFTQPWRKVPTESHTFSLIIRLSLFLVLTIAMTERWPSLKLQSNTHQYCNEHGSKYSGTVWRNIIFERDERKLLKMIFFNAHVQLLFDKCQYFDAISCEGRSCCLCLLCLLAVSSSSVTMHSTAAQADFSSTKASVMMKLNQFSGHNRYQGMKEMLLLLKCWSLKLRSLIHMSPRPHYTCNPSEPRSMDYCRLFRPLCSATALWACSETLLFQWKFNQGLKMTDSS